MDKTRTSGLSITAMILGILSLVLVWAPFVGVILGILSIIFGGIGMGQTRRDPNLGGRGMAIAGLVCGIIGVAIWVLLVALFGMALVFSSSSW